MVVKQEDMGFRIDNINFRQAVKIPSGHYSFRMKVKPTSTSLQFGYLMQGESTVTTVTITDLTANVLQEVQKAFTTSGVMLWFYPARQLNAEIHELTLNQGDKAIEPQPHPLDSNHYSESRIQILRDEISLKVSNAEMESAINQKADEINLTVSNIKDGLESEINQKSDEINLTVDNLKDDLEATGVKISTKEIEVVAPKFKIRKPNGGTVAVFDENINIDDDGNMRLKSLRTPFALKTQWSGVDFDDTPNVILTNFAGSGDLVLPSGEKYNGQHINIIWDMFFNTDISPTRILFRLKPAGTGKIFSEKGSRDDFIRLSTHERVYIGLLGYWANGVLNWIVTDKVNRSSVQPSFKAGEVVYSANVLLGSVSVYENKIVGAPSMVSVASNIIQIDCPTIFVLNDSGSLISRLLDRNYIAPLVQTDEYTRAVVQDYNTTYNRFLLKNISRTNIASSSAAAQNPTFRFSLVAVRDFSQLYQNL